MEHVHLHIISSDLMSDCLKNKKHYNSFHPSHGFFLHLDDVLSWFELPDDEYRVVSSITHPVAILNCFLVGWRLFLNLLSSRG